MELAFSLILLFLFGIVSIPLWLHLIDAYKQNNFKRGVIHIIGFVFFVILGSVLISYYGIWFAVSIPLIFLLFLIILVIKNKTS